MIGIIERGGESVHDGVDPLMKSIGKGMNAQAPGLGDYEVPGYFGQQLLFALFRFGSETADSEAPRNFENTPPQRQSSTLQLDAGNPAADPAASPASRLDLINVAAHAELTAVTVAPDSDVSQGTTGPTVDQRKRFEKLLSPTPHRAEPRTKDRRNRCPEAHDPITLSALANRELFQSKSQGSSELASCEAKAPQKSPEELIFLSYTSRVESAEKVQGGAAWIRELNCQAANFPGVSQSGCEAQSFDSRGSTIRSSMSVEINSINLSQVDSRSVYSQSAVNGTADQSSKFAALHGPGSNSSMSFASALTAPSLVRRHGSLNAHGSLHDGSANKAGKEVPVVQKLLHTPVPQEFFTDTLRNVREHPVQGGSGAGEEPSQSLDPPIKLPEQRWIHAGVHFAEAGFQDASLGWVSVRAVRDPEGLHAVIVPPSSQAERALHAHLAALNEHLGASQIPIGTVTLSPFRDSQGSAALDGDTQRQHHQRGDEHRDNPRPASIGRAALAGQSGLGHPFSGDTDSLMLCSGSVRVGSAQISLVA